MRSNSILLAMAAASLGALFGSPAVAQRQVARKQRNLDADGFFDNKPSGIPSYRAHSPGMGSSDAAERRKALKKRNQQKNKRAHRGRRG